MLGYGGSDKPDDIAEYTTKRLCNDLAALLDHEGIPKVVIVGHDWGAQTAWRFALWYPNRVRMIAWRAQILSHFSSTNNMLIRNE